jgi:multicomponent Na+:H+ antiporter subunit G
LVLIPETVFLIPALTGLVGAIGIIKLPNVYTRIFASTMCAVGCTCLLVFLLAVNNFYSVLAMKYLVLLALITLTAPTASHTIANAAYKNRVDLVRVEKSKIVKKKNPGGDKKR